MEIFYGSMLDVLKRVVAKLILVLDRHTFMVIILKLLKCFDVNGLKVGDGVKEILAQVSLVPHGKS